MYLQDIYQHRKLPLQRQMRIPARPQSAVQPCCNESQITKEQRGSVSGFFILAYHAEEGSGCPTGLPKL